MLILHGKNPGTDTRITPLVGFAWPMATAVTYIHTYIHTNITDRHDRVPYDTRTGHFARWGWGMAVTCTAHAAAMIFFTVPHPKRLRKT
jgi:hypothetical protein